MLIMFTPSLACAMSFCPMQKAQAADMPCHQSGDDKTKAPMMFKDCMGVDLFQQDVSHDFQPDQSLEKVEYVWAGLLSDISLAPNSSHDIRGPPDWPDILRLNPSIILTTQRLRI